MSPYLKGHPQMPGEWGVLYPYTSTGATGISSLAVFAMTYSSASTRITPLSSPFYIMFPLSFNFSRSLLPSRVAPSCHCLHLTPHPSLATVPIHANIVCSCYSTCTCGETVEFSAMTCLHHSYPPTLCLSYGKVPN